MRNLSQQYYLTILNLTLIKSNLFNFRHEPNELLNGRALQRVSFISRQNNHTRRKREN